MDRNRLETLDTQPGRPGQETEASEEAQGRVEMENGVEMGSLEDAPLVAVRRRARGGKEKAGKS